MKKLLLISIFALFAGFASGQNLISKQLVTNDTILADTGYVLRISDTYNWQLFVKWANNTDSLTFIIQQGINGIDYANYAGIDTVITTAASGVVAFEDWFATGSYLKLRAIPTDSAVVNLWYNLKRK